MSLKPEISYKPTPSLVHVLTRWGGHGSLSSKYYYATTWSTSYSYSLSTPNLGFISGSAGREKYQVLAEPNEGDSRMRKKVLYLDARLESCRYDRSGQRCTAETTIPSRSPSRTAAQQGVPRRSRRRGIVRCGRVYERGLVRSGGWEIADTCPHRVHCRN